MSDALKTITENTERFNGGAHMAVRYVDIMHPQKEDTRTGAEIAADVLKKAGLTLISTEGGDTE